MRKGKKALLVLAAMTLIASEASTMTPASAAVDSREFGTVESIIVPMWENTNRVLPGISCDGETITAATVVSPKDYSSKTTGTMYLQEYRKGSWKAVASWEIYGNGGFSKECTFTGKKGVSYRVRVDAVVGGESLSSVSKKITI